MLIVAIDPGPHIGWAQYDDAKDKYSVYMYHNIPEMVYQQIFRLKPDVLVIEKFTIVPGARVSKDGVETIVIYGGCRAAAALCGAKITTQYPSEMAIPYVLRAKAMLKELGVPHPTEHHADALTHLLAYQSKVERGLL